MNNEISRIRDEVAQKARPSAQERAAVTRVLELVTSRIEKAANTRKLNVKVEVEGSVAKDTWIGSDRDIDIFIIFTRGTDTELVKKEGLELAKKASGRLWKLGYAEHPYVEAEIDGCTVDVVPSLEIGEGERPLTSVDRTPLHTHFMKERLDERMKDDVRVLKQFMKGIGVYGAELRVGGFSGYLCELLVLSFGGFENAVKAAAGWGERVIVDYMQAYKGGEASKAFSEPLVLIDPVDRRRNVAAAVSAQSFFTFIAASRYFLNKPSDEFFYPKPPRAVFPEILRMLKEKGTSIVGILISCPQLPSDILWGEIQKSLSRIVALIEDNGFTVNGSVAWSDEKDSILFLAEVMGEKLTPDRVHQGPKLSYVEEAGKFVEKYLKDERVLAGPYVKDGRWFVELRREYTDLKTMIQKEFLDLRLSKDISTETKRGFRTLVDGELEGMFREREGIRATVLKLVRKTPTWLR